MDSVLNPPTLPLVGPPTMPSHRARAGQGSIENSLLAALPRKEYRLLLSGLEPVTLTFGNNASRALQDRHLTLRPAIVTGETRVPIAWICSKAAVPNGMQVMGMDRTDIQSNYLPVECR